MAALLTYFTNVFEWGEVPTGGYYNFVCSFGETIIFVFLKNYVFNCVDIKVLVLLKLDMLTWEHWNIF